MADFQNAGYRLLSFQFTPAPATSLPSLSSLLTSLEEIEAASNEPDETENKSALEVDEHVSEMKEDDHLEAKPKGLTQTPPKFHRFPDLPAEIRLKIWALTFVPRVVELRPTRPSYSQGRTDNALEPQWQSGNTNPAALSVNIEAREAALAHFRIAFPLAFISTLPTPMLTPTITAPLTPPSSSSSIPVPSPSPFAHLTPNTSNTLRLLPTTPSPKSRLLHRTLHLSPTHDTVCLLGRDSTDLARLAQVIASLRAADPLGEGISLLGLSVRGWGYGGSAVMLRTLGKPGGVLGGLQEVALFMYGEHHPPAEWRARGELLGGGGRGGLERGKGNRCALVELEEGGEEAGAGGRAWSAFKFWSVGAGRQFWDGEGNVIRMGRERRDVRFLDLVFEEGW